MHTFQVIRINLSDIQKAFKNCYLLMFLCLLQSQLSLATEEKKTYVVGSENISYYPHYDFVNQQRDTYIKALLDKFAESQNIEFVYIALPIKRLHLALSQGVIDFAYPDNPKWHANSASQLPKKHYSQALTIAMGSTIVRRINLKRHIDNFRSLAVPYGFSPVHWFDRVKTRKVILVEVKDARAALELVRADRVHGADVEYHVANHIMQTSDIDGLVMDPKLPYDPVGFALSSFEHQHMLLALNDFIQASPQIVNHLKAKFELREPDAILKQLAVGVPPE